MGSILWFHIALDRSLYCNLVGWDRSGQNQEIVLFRVVQVCGRSGGAGEINCGYLGEFAGWCPLSPRSLAGVGLGSGYLDAFAAWCPSSPRVGWSWARRCLCASFWYCWIFALPEKLFVDWLSLFRLTYDDLEDVNPACSGFCFFWCCMGTLSVQI